MSSDTLSSRTPSEKSFATTHLNISHSPSSKSDSGSGGDVTRNLFSALPETNDYDYAMRRYLSQKRCKEPWSALAR
ncbi:hypothetical protein GJ744_008715 [Endocarpon pusillum]|uniref:Uncharacterized protein n=1 Tax=Endocarpon pusillum TaxID=364733 RepID=A0A8H7AGZ4_9EURO|nr:hypothetical protein GJ744_008715 [Endocarpon pusillum]